MATKLRLSASVDAKLIAAGQAAVTAGGAENLSSWVNEALTRQVEHDQKMQALDDFIAQYEAEHGEITQADMDRVDRQDRARAIVVRSSGAATQQLAA
ncbi:MAG: hypothetical protein DLM55_10400 [Acidimicrobiales bacterium]|nr:MAG: hypothetical protein DLM55_10400 [Acidimicrobiales bacterium]